jgi:cyclophilin family peptidyl-prolyl cis-trans isomerase
MVKLIVDLTLVLPEVFYMLSLKKITAAAVSCFILAGITAGCGNDDKSSSVKVDPDSVMNYTAPEKDEEIIVMTVKGYGDIKIKLFPELCSKGVENFVTHAKDGYYDGLIFHRVIEDFMIQGGDPTGTGMGGESIWGEKFDGGVTPALYHFTGALAYANSGSTATNGSQFYIVSGPDSYDDATAQQYTSAYSQKGIKVPQEAVDNYKKYGGAWHLDGLSGNYTVFGQVFDGLDIVEEISKTATDQSDRPQEDVVIEKVSVEKYDGEDVKFFLSDYE